MEATQRQLVQLIVGILLIGICFNHASGESPLGEEWEKFLQEKVSFRGFVENTTGLSVSHGSRFFDTSNRFIMNRLTLQPEINVDMADWAKFFISWRFVKEPRYNAEAKSREKSVTYFPRLPLNRCRTLFTTRTALNPGKPFSISSRMIR
jgi:hypothetical protein